MSLRVQGGGGERFLSGNGWFKRFREDVDVNTAVTP